MNSESLLHDMATALAMVRGQRITNEVGDALLEVLHRSLKKHSAPAADFPPITFYSQKTGRHVFAHERIEDVLADIRPLHVAHWRETEGYRHGLTLNPDYRAFIAHERAGRFNLFTVRRLDTGKLVGNCGVYLARSTHHQQWIATEDTLYLLPEERRGHLAGQFVKYVERALAEAGVREVRITVKRDLTLGKPMPAEILLTRAGYSHVANELVKVLDHVEIPARAA